MFHSRIETINFGEVFEILGRFSAFQWGLATCASCISFWAIGRYDAVMHRVLNTGVSPALASQSGACAIAVAQFVGFGILSGALVRLRMLPGISFPAALRLSVAVSMSFIVGWALLCLAALIVLPHTVAIPPVLPGILAMAVFCLTVAILLFPRVFARLPSLLSIGAFTGLVALDLGCAAIALFIFIPWDGSGAIAQFLVVYLLAFGAGLISGTPAGMGPFELTMVSLLPVLPSEHLMASILAYRFVYFVLPATCAVFFLIKPQKSTVELLGETNAKPPRPLNIEKILWSSDRAEMSLLRQGDLDHEFLSKSQLLLSATCGQSHVAITPPARNQSEATRVLAKLKEQGRTKMRACIGYKCGARLAATARKSGWTVLPIVQEAWITPNRFSTQTQGLGQLRRHLKKACCAGVELREFARSDAVLSDMRNLAEDWALRHGGERRLTMGRFDPEYITSQRVFLAYAQGELVGFVTFHETQNEWALDLMRYSSEVPQGTMFLLITDAIERASAENVARVSLAATPVRFSNLSPLVQKFYTLFNRHCGGDGLYQFKNAFRPKWKTLYAIAPTPLGMGIGLFDVIAAIKPKKSSQKRHIS